MSELTTKMKLAEERARGAADDDSPLVPGSPAWWRSIPEGPRSVVRQLMQEVNGLETALASLVAENEFLQKRSKNRGLSTEKIT